MARRLLRSAARCLRCDGVVESRRPEDVQTCSCGALSISGGLAEPHVSFEARPGAGWVDESVEVEVLDGGLEDNA